LKLKGKSLSFCFLPIYNERKKRSVPMSKIIKYIPVQEQRTDVRYCDCCSAKPAYRTKDYSYFVCSSCANRLNFSSKSLVEIPDSHISQVCAHKPVQTKPKRYRKRDYVAFRRNLEICRADALVSSPESEQAESASAKLLKANKRLLKKHFEPSA